VEKMIRLDGLAESDEKRQLPHRIDEADLRGKRWV